MSLTTNYTTLSELNHEYDMGIKDEEAKRLDSAESCYNCMGFALGTYDWEEIDVYGYGEEEVEEIDEDGESYYEYKDSEPDINTLGCAVDEVLYYSDHESKYGDDTVIRYPHIRFLGYLSDYSEQHYIKELEEGEYLVAMRLASDDFHFARRMEDGIWYHKPGYTEIRSMEYSNLDSDANWNFKYYGDIALFAVTPVKEVA